jgi:hypothetical protein
MTWRDSRGGECRRPIGCAGGPSCAAATTAVNAFRAHVEVAPSVDSMTRCEKIVAQRKRGSEAVVICRLTSAKARGGRVTVQIIDTAAARPWAASLDLDLPMDATK